MRTVRKVPRHDAYALYAHLEALMKQSTDSRGSVVALVFVVVATLRDARPGDRAAAIAPALPSSMPGTSRAELTSTVSTMTARLAADPANAAAVVSLANALIRLQRVNNDGRAVIAAEEHLRALLSRQPDHYDARRMLAAVLLSQHRFGDAIAEANKAMAADPRDAWNYGAAGDGYMELGDYARAFEAFDRMGQLQPGPPAYARTAYALEIKGDLDGALEYMRRAADGTSPERSGVAGLALRADRRSAAAAWPRRRRRGSNTSAPMRRSRAIRWRSSGLARVKMIDGDLEGGAADAAVAAGTTATPDLASAVGDLSSAIGDATAADQYYQMAEQIERAAWGNGLEQPQVLARILSERPGRAAEAVQLAEEAARDARRHRDDGYAGVGVLQERTDRGGASSVGAGIAHRHAQRPHPLSCGGRSAPPEGGLLLRLVHPAPFVAALNGVLDQLLGFLVGLAFDARVQIDVDDPGAERLEVRLLLIGAPQAVGAAQAFIGRVVLMQPLRRLHHVGAMALQLFRGQLAGLLVELPLLELHRKLQLLNPPLLPVDLADQDDNDDDKDGGEETRTVDSHCRPSSFKLAYDSTD